MPATMISRLIVMTSLLISVVGFAQPEGKRPSSPITEEKYKKIAARRCPYLTAEACKKQTGCLLMKTCSGKEFCSYPFSDTSRKCGEHAYYGQQVPCCPGTKAVCVDENNLRSGEAVPYCLACGNAYCEFFESEKNCPEDCKRSGTKNVKYRLFPNEDPESTKPLRKKEPTILANPWNKGDIPQLTATLKKAYDEKNISICQNLPEPQKQRFNHGDYSTVSPKRSSWVTYCEALVKNDSKLCYSISSVGVTPNLNQDCEYFFSILNENQNDSPQFCLDQVGNLYTTSGAVKKCLFSWRNKIYGDRPWDELRRNSSELVFSEKLIELDLCLTKDGKEMNACLYDLAVRTKDEKICRLMPDPYDGIYKDTSSPGVRKSQRHCLQEVAPQK